MSQRQLLNQIKDALQDATIGLTAQAVAVAAAEGLVVSTAFALDRWMLTGQMKATGQHNVTVTPRAWAANTMLPNETYRDAIGTFDIAFETFAADAGVIEDTISVFATALIRVLDLLRDWSDAHAGTVVQVIEAVSFSFGTFEGNSATSSGFRATVNVQERSSE